MRSQNANLTIVFAEAVELQSVRSMKHKMISAIPTGARPGFSLIATITILVLLALIAIGLLSLSAITIRSGSQGAYREEARANARLALQIALGELQQHLGPDRRVSARASILDENSDTAQIDGVGHPNWTGVWRTVADDGESYLVRNEHRGGLIDSRANAGWERDDEVLSYLVSGNESELRFDPRQDDLGGDGSVVVVGGGSVGDNEEADVTVPLVKVSSGRSRGGGDYGWWVGDLGCAANVAVVDPYEPERASASSPGSGGWNRVMMSQDASAEAMKFGTEISPRIRERLASRRSVELNEEQGTEEAVAFGETNFHDITVWSSGVLADVRDGGLKKDLTAYLESTGAIDDLGAGQTLQELGVKDDDNLVGPLNAKAAKSEGVSWARYRHRLTSPKFGLLRQWAQWGKQLPFQGASAPSVSPLPEVETGPMYDSYDYLNPRPVSLQDRSKNGLNVTLVEGSLYYNISYYTDEGSEFPFRLRLHLYPRVVLWNPYNVRLQQAQTAFMLHVNGAKDVEFTLDDGSKQRMEMFFGRGGALRGTLVFRIPPTTFEPGDCLVFSPYRLKQYDESSISENVLSSEVAPDSSVNFYLDRRADGAALFGVLAGDAAVANRLRKRPQTFREVFDAHAFQADDYRMMLKDASSSGQNWNNEDFDTMPQLQFVSCALQYGDNDEFPVEWNKFTQVPVLQSQPNSAVIREIPDVRTRDGFRLRWFNEHPSNEWGSGSLRDTPHFHTAPMATWNMRSSYSLRSPWENVTDADPVFFGVYTRDLFDQAVSFTDLMPTIRGGRMHGNPFGQPVEGNYPRVLFDLPRSETGISSLGAFQHVKLSEFVWHPTYAVGNSLVDPRLELEGKTGTELERIKMINRRDGGWNRFAIGWATDGRADDNEKWAFYARGLLQNLMNDETLAYDLSYEVNHTLWDRYFLSTGSFSDKTSFFDDPIANPLPNGRMRLLSNRAGERGELLRDFHRAASCLMLDGAFNVNSTSVEAWKALLTSTRNARASGGGAAEFARILNPPAGEWKGQAPDGEGAWSGYRSLSEAEVSLLAEAIVGEVKRRGPFLSLSEFVNRRLLNDEKGTKGALQAAIDQAGLNRAFETRWPLSNDDSLPDFNHRDNIRDPTRVEQTLKPDSQAWGAPGFLTQADVLQVVGPVLAARSDTFMIRAYGAARDQDGKIVSRAWCEAIAQRVPEPLTPDQEGLNSDLLGEENDFGRRFEIRSFRWLGPDEV